MTILHQLEEAKLVYTIVLNEAQKLYDIHVKRAVNTILTVIPSV
jgi:hypothetical protein